MNLKKEIEQSKTQVIVTLIERLKPSNSPLRGIWLPIQSISSLVSHPVSLSARSRNVTVQKTRSPPIHHTITRTTCLRWTILQVFLVI